MEKALSAYSDEHILRYLNDVKTKGLTEHGFPRLTANIGILIAHGRRLDLLTVFTEMMDVCCDMFLRPYVRAANEFSIREIVCCIAEIDKAKSVKEEILLCWKQKISQIVPEECYNVVVKDETALSTNWAIFGAASECARCHYGLGENLDFIDRQLSCQFKWLDENGMYKDDSDEEIHQPMMYDLVSRGLLAMLLHWGYKGKFYEQIDDCLKTAGLLSLKMQSTTGEIPFGGRSNQFLFNEAWMIALFEYEARRYSKEGNSDLAEAFKAAVAHGLSVTEEWLNKEPIRHIKNRFPTETKYGCEDYGYFDKYMITAASNLYAAYLLCDDSIPSPDKADHESVVFQTSHNFHKLFLKSGGYAIEYDTNADPIYDSNGLGRVHKEGAPSAICLSCPCPPLPCYNVDIEDPFAFSLCSAISEKGSLLFCSDNGNRFEVISAKAEQELSSATVMCSFTNGITVKEHYTVSKDGVSITVEGDGDIGYTIPAFCFDGEVSPEICVGEHILTVTYNGWICRYTTDGNISDLNRIAANRNGHYRAYVATGKNILNLKIEIEKI